MSIHQRASTSGASNPHILQSIPSRLVFLGSLSSKQSLDFVVCVSRYYDATTKNRNGRIFDCSGEYYDECQVGADFPHHIDGPTAGIGLTPKCPPNQKRKTEMVGTLLVDAPSSDRVANDVHHHSSHAAPLQNRHSWNEPLDKVRRKQTMHSAA